MAQRGDLVLRPGGVRRGAEARPRRARVPGRDTVPPGTVLDALGGPLGIIAVSPAPSGARPPRTPPPARSRPGSESGGTVRPGSGPSPRWWHWWGCRWGRWEEHTS